jgi:hypothetical protein
MEIIISIAILFLAVYIALGIRVVPEAEAWVVERFGQRHRICQKGLHLLCLPGLVDRVRQKVSLKLERTDLYKDETGNEIDFACGTSAPVKAQAWHKVGDSDEDIYKSVYEIDDPINFIEEVFDHFARPELEAKTLEEAQTKKFLKQLAKEAISELRDIIHDASGIWIDLKEGFLLTDIVIPAEYKAQRIKEIEGQKDAERATKRGKGYADAIAAIMKAAKESASPINFQEARDIFEKQRALETLEARQGNMNFVSPDIKGVMMSMGIDGGTNANKPTNGGKKK